MKTLGEKVRERRLELKLSQDALAYRLGYNHRSSISNIEKGLKGLPRDQIKKMADVLGVSPEYLMGWDEKVEVPINEPVVYLNIYGDISCGNGMFVDDNVIETMSLPLSMLPRGRKEFFAQYATGDSMIDANIHEGDLLVFSKEQCESGDIGCFCIDENIATCKKLKIVGTQILLLPMNDKYEPIIVEPENFKCVGKLVLTINKVR